MFSNELAKRYGDQGIISNAVNPGDIKTEIQRHVASYIQTLSVSIFVATKIRRDSSQNSPEYHAFPAPMGALTQLWGGTSPDTKDYNGEFLIPWARLGTAGKYVLRKGQDKVLWDWIEQQRYGH
ncbi:hypothetical protein FRC02_005449 [Tulasnella sp. 418]|nr:hypothetical protein FRC02_005449 [Tulasnella sp. 418]